MNQATVFKTIKAAALTVLLFLLTGSPVLAAKAMPSFTLSSVVDDKKISSDAFQDKVLLVTFFATWCSPCREEIPEFIELQNKRGPQGFSVLGISVDETGPASVKTLIEQEKINYPVAMADESVLTGFGGISGIPTSFLINRKGNVVKQYPGYVPRSVLMVDIEQVMAEK
ncbi:TlpA family protein disulfide reductase [Desulfobulbus sp. F3]|nr:TlpA family protein disulfide reductase [Desulfobulbus sp. F3]